MSHLPRACVELCEKWSCQRNVIALSFIFRASAKTVTRGQNPSQQMTDCFCNMCTAALTSVSVWPDCSVCLGGRKWAKADSSSRVLFTDKRQLRNIVYHLPARLRTCLISFAHLKTCYTVGLWCLRLIPSSSSLLN